MLSDKTAIVTGGSRGIGEAIVCKLASRGTNVAVIYAGNTSAAEKVCAYCKEQYEAEVKAYQCNVADFAGVKETVDTIKKDFGTVHILVNNAGITRDAMTRKMTDEQWDLVVDINLKGIFNLVRYVGPFMEEIGGGSIINISSVVGEYGNIGQANYAATKAGVIGLTKTWAKEFARKGVPVRVNAIAPGYIMTDMMKTVPEDLLKKFAGLTMLGRLGQPEEIAKAALFLASDDASYVTGHVLSVNGGMRL
jgi:3-oxoacyl-[acyl-carrier protein] reductase